MKIYIKNGIFIHIGRYNYDVHINKLFIHFSPIIIFSIKIFAKRKKLLWFWLKMYPKLFGR